MRDYGDFGRPSSPTSLVLVDEKAFCDDEPDAEKASLHQQNLVPPWHKSFSSRLQIFRPQSWYSTLFRSAFAALPSFAQNILCSTRTKTDRLGPTAYLDGMRGLAALFVFFCHYSYTSYVITLGYGYGEGGEEWNLLRLPVVRLLYSGPPMVCLFFVISGYALSFKPLKQMRSHSWDALFTTMTSSIFRRAFRLFLPTTLSTFMVVLMLRFGWYEGTREFANNKDILRNVIEYHPQRLPTLAAQLNDWGWQMFNFIHIWGWEQFGGSTNYDLHLWTIPVEFRCSMLLFLVLIGLARLKTWLRFTFLAIVTWFCYLSGRWEAILFLSGMCLAELDIIGNERAARQSAPDPQASPRSRNVLWVLIFCLSMYFLSQPDNHYAETPGWIWLSSWIPPWFEEGYRYWQCVGSVFFVLAVNKSTSLQKPFVLPFVQYLGKISYALYLMHGPVIHVIGYRVEAWAWSITGLESGWQYNSGFILAALFNVPLVIWASDLFWRACDVPSVRFARWIEAKCIDSSEL